MSVSLQPLTRRNLSAVLISIVEPAPHLLAFYGSLAFVPTDLFDDGERVLRLVLR